MTPFPWGPAMQFGFGVLRLSSRDFWALSPRELAAAYAAHYRHTGPINRQLFEELMTKFPDKESDNGGV